MRASRATARARRRAPRSRGARRPGVRGNADCAGADDEHPRSHAVPPAVPAPGAVSMSLQKAGGSPPFAMVDQRIAYRGTVTPFVDGQTVKVSIYRDGRKIVVEQLAVTPGTGGKGKFHFSFSSGRAGVIKVRVVHYATAAQAQFAGSAPEISYVHTRPRPRDVGGIGAAVAVGAERAALRGSAVGRVR